MYTPCTETCAGHTGTPFLYDRRDSLVLCATLPHAGPSAKATDTSTHLILTAAS